MLIAEVIIPLAVEGSFSYELPPDLRTAHPEVGAGCRVAVPFGAKRYYTGVIRRLREEDEGRRCKPIDQVLDASPLISEEQLRLWDWVSYYYCCPLGSVLRIALPAGLLPESQTILRLAPDFATTEPLSPLEFQILDTLRELGGEGLAVDRLEKILGRRLVRPIAHLVALGALLTEELLQQTYRPRLIRVLRLAPHLQQDDEALSQAYATLSRAPRQAELLGTFARLLEEHNLPLSETLPRSLLLEHHPQGSAPLRALIDKGILEQLEQPKSRIELGNPVELPPLPPVSKLEHPVSLYWGQSTHAKEDYLLRQVHQTLEEGGQVLFLTPTVTLTPSSFSFLSRLSRLLPEGYYPYHSLLGEPLRVETYRRLTTLETPALVVGTRTAVFLPLPKLSLIVIDEEQEYLYKQQTTAPLFHARDVALWRAHQRGARVLLASCTPSAEVVFHALRGKYALLSEEGATPTAPPALVPIQTIDLKGLRQSKAMPYGYALSPYLYDRIKAVISQGKTALLLQNRRGYAPYLLCSACGSRLLCPHCDVSLTYHQSRSLLICHYCGHSEPPPPACPHCGATEVETKSGVKPALREVGYGIERVEEEVQRLFPDHAVVRIDSDSLSSRRKQVELQARLEAEGTEILIGTQLIKGQSVWGEVGLIGVVQLDALLGYPDFRSYERAYQLLYQLRLRGAEQGGSQPECLVQTNDPENLFLQILARGNYESFIHQTLEEREALHYPPLWRMTYIYLKGKDARLVAQVGLHLSLYLKALLPQEEVSEALTPHVGRVDGLYIQRILVRRPFTTSYQDERVAFASAQAQLHTTLPESRRVSITIDVDPL